MSTRCIVFVGGMVALFAIEGCGDSKSPTTPSSLADPSAALGSSSTLRGAASIKLSGGVTTLAGNCPTLTFRVNGTTVTTDGSTQFDRGACREVQPGANVEVEGIGQPDGTTLALEVEVGIEPQDDDSVDDDSVDDDSADDDSVDDDSDDS